MKIKIAFTKAETPRAEELAALYFSEMKKHGSVTMTRSDSHKPFYHIYISDGRKKAAPRNANNSKSTGT